MTVGQEACAGSATECGEETGLQCRVCEAYLLSVELQSTKSSKKGRLQQATFPETLKIDYLAT